MGSREITNIRGALNININTLNDRRLKFRPLNSDANSTNGIFVVWFTYCNFGEKKLFKRFEISFIPTSCYCKSTNRLMWLIVFRNRLVVRLPEMGLEATPSHYINKLLFFYCYSTETHV